MKTKQDIINNYAHDYLRGHFSKENITTSLTQMVREIDDVYKEMINCKYYENRSLKVETVIYKLNNL